MGTVALKLVNYHGRIITSKQLLFKIQYTVVAMCSQNCQYISKVVFNFTILRNQQVLL
jgi:hypothetical protein